MAEIHNEKTYGLKLRESADDGSDFSNPDADYRLLFLGEDGFLHAKDSAGAVSDPYDTSGLGGVPGGTSFPGSPSNNEHFYRTDRDLLYFYDGTRWLTVDEHEVVLQSLVTAGIASDSQSTYFMPIRADGDTFLTKFYATTYISAAPAVWQLELYKVASASLAETLITAGISTSGDAAATGTRHEVDIDALVPNGTFMLLMRINEVSGSATFTGAAALRYRRVG